MSKIKMTESDEKFIRENFENADELINSEDPHDVLYALFCLVDENLHAPNYEYNDLAEEADNVYFSIYNLN